MNDQEDLPDLDHKSPSTKNQLCASSTQGPTSMRYSGSFCSSCTKCGSETSLEGCWSETNQSPTTREGLTSINKVAIIEDRSLEDQNNMEIIKSVEECMGEQPTACDKDNNEKMSKPLLVGHIHKCVTIRNGILEELSED